MGRSDFHKVANSSSNARELLSTIRNSRDTAAVSWAAAGLALHCVDLKAASVPSEAASIIADRIWTLQADFGTPLSEAAREAASVMFSVLVDLMRCRPDDMEFVRGRLAEDTEKPTGWLTAILDIMATVGSGGAVANAGGAAFVNACHLLALAAEDDGDLCRRLRNAGVLGLVGQCMLWGTTGGNRLDFGAPPSAEILGTEWSSFATASARLMEVLVCAMDPDRFIISNPELFQPVWVRNGRADGVVDACLAALHRSLHQEGGCMVAQSLHLSGLRTLGEIGRLSTEQARRIMCHNGLTFGVALLSIPHLDEEATSCALWYLAELSAASDQSAPRRLKQLAAAPAAERAMTKYPRSQTIHELASRVLAASSAGPPPVAKTEASARARRELSRQLAERVG